jgi:hypothetical protein
VISDGGGKHLKVPDEELDSWAVANLAYQVGVKSEGGFPDDSDVDFGCNRPELGVKGR